MAEVRGAGGRLRGSTVDAQNPRHLLQGLVRCAACGSAFRVAGANGQYLQCGEHATGKCGVATQLHRARAERLLLDALGGVILRDPEWRGAVERETVARWEEASRSQPNERDAAEKRLAAVEAKVARLLDAVEDGDGGPELNARLAERRRERDELRRRLDTLRRERPPAAPPTAEWVAGRLAELHAVVAGGGPAAAVALRNLVGRVVVEERRPARGKRKFLRGAFAVPAAVFPEAPAAGPGGERRVTIDFADPPPWAAVADDVKRLHDAGRRHAEIAAELGCPRSWPAEALRHWHESRGLPPPPDGRAARSRLAPAAGAVALEDRARALLDAGSLMHEVAAELGVCRDTVTALVRAWHGRLGLPAPDGRARRKTLERKSAAI